MYKISIIVLAVAVVSSALPMEFEHEIEQLEPNSGIRHARATCDLLSFSAGGFSVNHSACAAHCLVLGRGFRGGRCINGICNCRR